MFSRQNDYQAGNGHYALIINATIETPSICQHSRSDCTIETISDIKQTPLMIALPNEDGEVQITLTSLPEVKVIEMIGNI